MAQIFSFTVSASPHPKAADAVLQDPQHLASVTQNLQSDARWGWCVPQVTVIFDGVTGMAELDRGSYPSKAAFLTSSDYFQLQELALHDIQLKLQFALKRFQHQVEDFYSQQGHPFHEAHQRLVQFD